MRYHPVLLSKKRMILCRIRRFRGIEGWLTDWEAFGLYVTIRKLPRKNATAVEIGSWKGKSTYCLARGLRKGTLHCIDPFDASGEAGSQELYEAQKGSRPLLAQFISTMTRLGVSEKINTLVGTSAQHVHRFSSIDLLFIDGDHSREGCTSDYDNYAPFLVTGGFLLLHDYDPARPELGPTWVIENRIIPSGAYEFVGLYDSLWVCRKIKR